MACILHVWMCFFRSSASDSQTLASALLYSIFYNCEVVESVMSLI